MWVRVQQTTTPGLLRKHTDTQPKFNPLDSITALNYGKGLLAGNKTNTHLRRSFSGAFLIFPATDHLRNNRGRYLSFATNAMQKMPKKLVRAWWPEREDLCRGAKLHSQINHKLNKRTRKKRQRRTDILRRLRGIRTHTHTHVRDSARKPALGLVFFFFSYCWSEN